MNAGAYQGGEIGPLIRKVEFVQDGTAGFGGRMSFPFPTAPADCRKSKKNDSNSCHAGVGKGGRTPKDTRTNAPPSTAAAQQTAARLPPQRGQYFQKAPPVIMWGPCSKKRGG